MKAICQHCGDVYEGQRSHVIKGKSRYCSRTCHGLARRGETPWNYSRIAVICETCGKPFLVNKAKANKRKYCSMDCYGQARSKNFAGENCPAWRGGISAETTLLRSNGDYKNWRRAVHRRDYWTCQGCGKKPRKIHAHHIKAWVEFPELRYEVSNGMTLCVPCHDRIHGRVSRYIPELPGLRFDYDKANPRTEITITELG